MPLKKDGTPMKKRGRPRTRPEYVRRGRPKGPRPELWVTGPDELKHSMYHPWQMAKAQAKFRDEGWDLDFEDYYEIWKDIWDQRGRGSDDLCMTRIDSSGPWSKANTEIVVRIEHLRRQNAMRTTPVYKGKRVGRPPKASK